MSRPPFRAVSGYANTTQGEIYMTKKQQKLWQQYKRANKSALHECYNTPSSAKCLAYNAVAALCWQLDGWCIRIPSYNTWMFTMAFLYNHNGRTMLHYETNCNVWDFEVPADQL